MQISQRTLSHLAGAAVALLLIAGCSSSDSDSTDAASSAAPEPAPTESAPTTEPTTEPTSEPTSSTDCTAAALAPALDVSASAVFGFECADGYAGVDFTDPGGDDATAILSSDDGQWNQVSKSVCEDDDFPQDIKKNYCDVS
ncbi:MAG: hypothetical protein K0U60_09655 [Actinomycetia bacterium]|nr:hypothetical protein [Actinomycetes bacterium]MCH9800917.1 hypothetical protein [Actinomycetes bacterium]